jgi:hypothetical protein
MAPGNGDTVTIILTVPHVVAYETVAVPVVKPVTVPVTSIVAIVVGAQLHAPPASALTNVIDVPSQKGVFPVIASGVAITVTIVLTVPHVVM